MEGLINKNNSKKVEGLKNNERIKNPPINYIEVVIDDEYIKKHMTPNGGLIMKGGHANWNNQVDIMRYVISPDLSPQYQDFVKDKIEKQHAEQEKTYQHESQHICNRENNLTPHKAAENLREFLTFRVLDELSAFTAGELYSQEFTIENILKSLKIAQQKIIDSYYHQSFIHDTDWYIKHHSNNPEIYSRNINTEKYHAIMQKYFITNQGNIISVLQESGKISEFTAIVNDLIMKLDPLLEIKK